MAKGRKSGGGVTVPVKADTKDATKGLKNLRKEAEETTKSIDKINTNLVETVTKLQKAYEKGQRVITKSGTISKTYLRSANVSSQEDYRALAITAMAMGVDENVVNALTKSGLKYQETILETEAIEKTITEERKKRSAQDVKAEQGKQKAIQETIKVREEERRETDKIRYQNKEQYDENKRIANQQERDNRKREKEEAKKAKEAQKAAEAEAKRFPLDRKLDQVTLDLAASTNKYKQGLGVVLDTTVKVISKNRKLSFTQELFTGITGALGRMIGYTKIMSSSIGLVSSAFGFLIDMIFLPLLPIVLAIAEGLFMLGEVANSFLEFIQGIPIIGETFAVILSFAGLLAIAFGMFLTGALLADVLGVAGGFKKIYDILKDISIMEGISSILSMLGFGGGKGDKTPDGGEGGGGGYYSTGGGKDKNKTKKPKKPSKVGGVLGKLKSVIPAAAGVVGSLATDIALPLAAGVGIVTAMNQLGVGQALSDFGESSGIQYNLRATSKDWNVAEHMYGAVGDLINVSTGFVTDTVNSVFGLSLEKFAAATPNMVEEALREGKYNQAVINAINQKLGENTIGYMGEEYADSIGKEAGYYLLNKRGEAYGERMTSYSNVLSNTANYNTYYQQTNGNGAFNLQNTAGL